MKQIRSRRMVAVAAALLALQTLAGPTLADTEYGHSGVVGRHGLRQDSHLGGGSVVCYYYDNQNPPTPTPPMETLTVRFPGVVATSTTSGIDSQVVGWRPRLQRRNADGTWSLVATLPIQRKTATDVTAAAFTAKVFTHDQIPDTGRLRVVVEMLWYARGATVSGGGTISGRAFHRADYYGISTWADAPDGSGGTYSTQEGYCPAAL